MVKPIAKFLFVIFSALLLGATNSRAQLTGTVNFVVLRVTFSDFGTSTRFTTATAQTDFGRIATSWGTQTSYGTINLHYQFAGPAQVASTSSTYLDIESGQSSSGSAIDKLVNDAVAVSPATINWNNVYGVVVLFADTRPTGFYRGITANGTMTIHPPGGGSFDVHRSIVGENPAETEIRTWGRWAHEMGHQMQNNPGNPWHPSNYNSDFEQMDGEYPAQSGMFNKQSNMSYPGWMPPGKYKAVSPATHGGSVGLLAEERPPSSQADYQAIKASLSFGGPQIYYLVSVRHHILGDEVADTHGPNGIPDEGVLIERVVEGGDPNVNDCPPTPSNPLSSCPRWVVVEGNGGNSDKLWHVGDTYKSVTDGIFIVVRAKPDDDHYLVDVAYADKQGQPNVGINSWVQPPGNTWETTDIWINSPVNGYGTYRYGMWSDLMGGTVPSGNGDDPAVGLVNHLYARVRNYGSMPAANIVVHFDITDPPGVGINGANGFVPLGTVDKTTFPQLALLQPGQSTDVYYNWTPNFTLTPQQIQQGIFYFHTCLRVRLDHVAGETFFGNQDGDGQQENVFYFQAGSATSPGAPGAPSSGVMHLRNDNPASSKEFELSMAQDMPKSSWKVVLGNSGQAHVLLAPGEMRDIPIVVTQLKTEPVGSRHSVKVYASSHQTLKNMIRPNDFHEEFKSLGGIQFQVAVLQKPKLACRARDGVVTGEISGLAPQDEKGARMSVYFSPLTAKGTLANEGGFSMPIANGRFSGKLRVKTKEGVCLYAGSQYTSSAASAYFPLQ